MHTCSANSAIIGDDGLARAFRARPTLDETTTLAPPEQILKCHPPQILKLLFKMRIVVPQTEGGNRKTLTFVGGRFQPKELKNIVWCKFFPCTMKRRNACIIFTVTEPFPSSAPITLFRG